MTEDTHATIEEVEIIEPNGNVIAFGSKGEEDSKEEFNFKVFLEKAKELEDTMQDFVFIGINDKGDTSVSAKAENNMHLYWMVKRFLTHLEHNIFA